MVKSLKTVTNFTNFFYVFLILVIFISCFLSLPFCRENIIKLTEIALHKNLSYEFWNKVILYTLVTISSFSFYWIISSLFSKYIKSEKYNLKQIMILVSLILFFASLLVQTVLLYNGIVYGADDPAYIAIAKEIAENTYKADYSKMSNSAQLIYTIGYPGLLAVIIKIFGMNFYAIKLVNVFLYASFVVVLFNLLFFLLKDIQISLFISSLFCLNFTISNWQNHTMSDTPCMVFSLFCLALIYNIYFNESKKKYLKAVLLGLCFFIAYECRINGLVCLLTLFVLHLLIGISNIFTNSKILHILLKDFSKMNLKIHLIPYIVFIVFVILQKIFYPNVPRQDSHFLAGLSFKTCFHHFQFFYVMYEFFNSAWNVVFHQFNILSKIAFYSALLLALYGLIKNWEKLSIFFIFAIGNISVYCLWGSFQGIRFYFPLFIPFAIFCAYGAKSTKDLFSGKIAITSAIIGKFFVICFCAMFTISIFPFYTRDFKNTIQKNGHSYTIEAQDIWTYINENIPNDKTFFFKCPRTLWLFTKHETVNNAKKSDYYLHSFDKPIDSQMKNFLTDDAVAENQIEIEGRVYTLEYSNDKFRLFHAVQ